MSGHQRADGQHSIALRFALKLARKFLVASFNALFIEVSKTDL